MNFHANVEKALLGSWFLLDYRSELENGTDTNYPMGKGARGILTYAPSGYVAVQLMPPVNKKVKETIHDLIAYTGRYWLESHPDGRIVVNHHVEMCSSPDLEGSIQQRAVQLTGNQLMLSSLAFMDLEVS